MSDGPRTKTFTAWFPLERYAVSFYERVGDGSGWYAEDVKRKGRTVTWLGPENYEYENDMLDTVGYYGSTQSRKAKLNDRPAPISY